MMDRLRGVLAAHAAVGAGVFAAAQFALFASSGEPGATDASGWFLNRGLNVLVMMSAMAAAAAGVTLAATSVPAWYSAGAVAAGAVVVMAATLFTIGPGSIFPIVIAVGALVLAIASGAGALIGRGVRRAFAR